MLRRYPTRIKSLEEATSLPNVGDRTARKVVAVSFGFERVYSFGLFLLSQIMEIIQTGGLVRIKFETTEDIKIIELFTGIYGVGEHFGFSITFSD